MNILIVGGNGMVGAHAALRLRQLGHDVVIASRTPPEADTPLGDLPWSRLDYVVDRPDAAWLGGFDALLFAAGQDMRHVPAGTTAEAHWRHANGEAVPRFFAAAKAAGVRRAVLIGSFYPQAAPELIATSPYVAGRKAADDGARALADARFHVVSLNAPIIIGAVPGLLIPAYDAFARWALGLLPLPRQVPPGGSNVISTDTLTDAIAGALTGGRNGRAYLIGDENLTWAALMGAFFAAAGDPAPLAVVDAPHPLLPDEIMMRGRGGTIYFEPPEEEVAELGYRRGDIGRTARLIVDAVRERL